MKEKMNQMRTEYGKPFLVWWTCTWVGTGIMVYAGIELGGVDSVGLVQSVDGFLGTELAARVDPKLGNLAVAVALNEMLEPVRLPLAIASTPTVLSMVRRLRK